MGSRSNTGTGKTIRTSPDRDAGGEAAAVPETVTTRVRQGGSYVVETDPATGAETVTRTEETAPEGARERKGE